MSFSFDIANDSGFTFHITIGIDSGSNTWDCQATCSGSDVSVDLQNINIPDGTYLPINSSFSCITDKINEKVRDAITNNVNFAGIMQTFLTNFLNNIPTSVALANGINFNFGPTALSMSDPTTGFAVGFNGDITFDNVPIVPQTINVPLPVPDPNHTGAVNIATYELQFLFFGLFAGKVLSKRFDQSSVAEQQYFNTANYQSIAPDFYNWAPDASIVLYLEASEPPTVNNIGQAWVLTDAALQTAGVSAGSDTYEKLQDTIKLGSIYTDSNTLDNALKFQLTSNEYNQYGTAIVSASSTPTLSVSDKATARVCIIDGSGKEVEAFVMSRQSDFQAADLSIDVVNSPGSANSVLTFDFSETNTINTLTSSPIPNLKEGEADFVLNALMMAVDSYVKDAGKNGTPIPGIKGFSINKVSVGFTPSTTKPYLDAVINLIADLTVN